MANVDRDYRKKLEDAEPMIANVCDWLRQQMIARISARSFGSQNFTFVWDDGNLLRVKLAEETILLPKKNDRLPLTGIDTEGGQT